MDRADKEKHRKQVRAGAKARDNAIRRLVAAHKKEYDKIYAEEAAKLGVIPMAVKRQGKIAKMKEEIAKLEGK